MKLRLFSAKHGPRTDHIEPIELKYINLLGVELEGAWLERPDNLHHDGSVDIAGYGEDDDHNCHECETHEYCNRFCEEDCEDHCSDDCIDHCDDDCETHCDCERDGYLGECKSPPLKPQDLFEFISENCPYEVNRSCGLHVHVSFNNIIDYARLMEKPFHEFFVEWMHSWGASQEFNERHQFWKRLKGENHYCLDIWRPELQADATEKRDCRYAQLNFAYKLHSTIECRLFPAFDTPEEIFACVKSLVECIETYLYTHEYIIDNLEVELIDDEITEDENDLVLV